MKFALLLLLALPSICFAMHTPPCNLLCPKIYAPVCVAYGGRHVYFENQCLLKYMECIKGRELPVVSEKLCARHSPDEGRKLINALANGSGSSTSSSESDQRSSESDRRSSESDDSSSSSD